jgi:hypothetical protein
MAHGTKEGRCDVGVQRVVWITKHARLTDNTHISISKPKLDFDEDYYFHKIEDIQSSCKLLMLERNSFTFMLAYLKV